MTRIQKIRHVFLLHFKVQSPLLLIGFLFAYSITWFGWSQVSEGIGRSNLNYIMNGSPSPFIVIFPPILAIMITWGVIGAQSVAEGHQSSGNPMNGIFSLLSRQPVKRNDIFYAKSLVFVLIAGATLLSPILVYINNPEIIIEPYKAQEKLESVYKPVFPEAHLVDSSRDRSSRGKISIPEARISITLFDTARITLVCVILYWLGFMFRSSKVAWNASVPLFVGCFVASNFAFEKLLFWYRGNEMLIWVLVAGLSVVAFFDARRRFVNGY